MAHVSFRGNPARSVRTIKPKGLFGKKLASLQTSITFATGVRFTPTTSQKEATDDEHISGVLDFGNATLSVRDSVSCTTYALRAGSVGGCGSLGHESDFLHVLSGANLLINIADGPRELSGKSGTVGPDEKTKGVIRQKVGALQTSITFAT